MIWKRTLACGLLCLLAGCITPKVIPANDIREVRYEGGGSVTGAPVTGLKEAIRGAVSADPDTGAAVVRPIRVLTVHGMITDRPGFSDDTQSAIALRLSLKPAGPPLEIVLERGYGVAVFDGVQPNGQSRLNRSVIRRTDWADSSGVTRLVFYELLWAPFRDEIKGTYFACFESETFRKKRDKIPNPEWKCPGHDNAAMNTDRTSFLNKGIKEGILVNGVSDAMIVAGEMGEVLKDDLNLAFCTIAQDELAFPNDTALLYQPDPEGKLRRCGYYLITSQELSGPDGVTSSKGFTFDGIFEDRKFFVITESLGSYFMFRTVWDRAQAEPDPLGDLTRDLINNAIVFMFANQTALIHLSALEPVCLPDEGFPDCPNPGLETVDEKLETFSAGSSQTTYVAFNDRDDLLGYELAPYLLNSGLAGRLINVSVRNPALGLPPVFRWFADVHTNQAKHPGIIDAIVGGLYPPRAGDKTND